MQFIKSENSEKFTLEEMSDGAFPTSTFLFPDERQTASTLALIGVDGRDNNREYVIVKVGVGSDIWYKQTSQSSNLIILTCRTIS